MFRLIHAAIVFLASVCLSAAAFALPITFIHEGSGSGSLDGNSFTDAAFVITAVGDTDDRVQISSDIFAIEYTTAQIAIDGLGTFGFLVPTRTFTNDSLVGFSRSGNGGLDSADLYNGPDDPTLGPWVMLTSVGPVVGAAYILPWSGFVDDVTTTGGLLDFNIEAQIEASFQAIVGAVPEPGSLALFGLGLAGLGFARRREAA